MKEEALKLAFEMDGIEFYDNPNSDPYEWACDAQRMILRLVEELDKKEHCCPDCGCHFVGEYPFNNAPQTKPTITKADGKVVAVTMTDDEHRVHEVLWEAPKPLSDEEIKQIFADQTGFYIDSGLVRGLAVMDFARAIEERHGIK